VSAKHLPGSDTFENPDDFSRCQLSLNNVKTGLNYMASKKGIFSAGDMKRGQSLVVHAIGEGREAAVAIDKYLRAGK